MSDQPDYYSYGRTEINKDLIKGFKPPVVWRFGTKAVTDDDFTVRHPFSAYEVDNGDNVLISNRAGRVFIVKKLTREVIEDYSNIDYAGNPFWASEHTDGDILTGSNKDKILKISRDTGKVVWSYGVTHPRCVIPWSDDIIAISSAEGVAADHVEWVRISDKTVVKSYDCGLAPLQLLRVHSSQAYGNTNETTILIGHDMEHYVEEVKYSDLSQVWKYGEGGYQAPDPKYAHLYNNAGYPHSAVRLGGIESAGSKPMEITIIGDNEMGRIIAVNGDKYRVWTLGSLQTERNRPDPFNFMHMTPHGMSLTREGNLLVCDSHGHQVIEVDISSPPEPRFSPWLPFWVLDSVSLVDTVETYGYLQVASYDEVYVQIRNDSANDADYRIRGRIIGKDGPARFTNTGTTVSGGVSRLSFTENVQFIQFEFWNTIGGSTATISVRGYAR